MAKKARDYAKRKAGYALQSCERVMIRMLELKDMFEGHPSGLGEYAEAIATMQLSVESAIKDFCVRAWGKVPDKAERWTGTGREHTNAMQAKEREG